MDTSQIPIDKETLKTVKDLASELIDLTGLKASVKIEHDKANEAVVVAIGSEEHAGLIIGRRGETISSLQQILGLIVRQKLGGWVRVIVNVGDYREKQEDQLKDLAVSTAERARETGKPQSLYNLNPSQRRIVHMSLSDEKDIETVSEGEGRDRHLVVSVKK